MTYCKTIKQYEIKSNLLDAIGNNANCGVTYHFRAKLFGREKPEQELKYRLIVSHCHNFDEVVKRLYDYPETFEIPEKFLKEYSEQELIYLKQVKNYLLLIGLKDYRTSKEKELLNSNWEAISKKKHKTLKDKLFMFKYQKNGSKLTKTKNWKDIKILKP